MSQSGAVDTAFVPGVVVETLTGNSGGPVGTDAAHNINTVGTGSITIAGNPATHTLTTELTGLTNHNVLVGAGTATITNVPPSATSGIPFISQGAAANPTFGTAVVAGGGTGDTSFLAFSVICGGTTSTSPLQNVASVGTPGQVLTSQGAGALPSFQTFASSITITGDSGGALTGNSFTFTGGTTGLTFAGAGTTETLGGTLAIAHGGTNATSMSTSTGIVKYDGTRLVTSSTALIDSSNRQTNTSQPAFFAYNTTAPTNVTGDGTAYTIVFDTELFDQNNNFDATSTFTAPVTGKYQFNVTILAQQATSAMTRGSALVTTARTYNMNDDGASFTGNNALQFSLLVPMTAGDTAQVTVIFGGGAKVVDIYGAAGDARTTFSGYLVC